MSRSWVIAREAVVSRGSRGDVSGMAPRRGRRARMCGRARGCGGRGGPGRGVDLTRGTAPRLPRACLVAAAVPLRRRHRRPVRGTPPAAEATAMAAAATATPAAALAAGGRRPRQRPLELGDEPLERRRHFAVRPPSWVVFGGWMLRTYERPHRRGGERLSSQSTFWHTISSKTFAKAMKRSWVVFGGWMLRTSDFTGGVVSDFAKARKRHTLYDSVFFVFFI